MAPRVKVFSKFVTKKEWVKNNSPAGRTDCTITFLDFDDDFAIAEK